MSIRKVYMIFYFLKIKYIFLYNSGEYFIYYIGNGFVEKYIFVKKMVIFIGIYILRYLKVWIFFIGLESLFYVLSEYIFWLDLLVYTGCSVVRAKSVILVVGFWGNERFYLFSFVKWVLRGFNDIN